MGAGGFGGRGVRLVAVVALVATTVIFAQPAAAALGISGTVGAPSATTFGKTVTFTRTVDNTGRANFTVTALITAAPTATAQLRLKVTGVTASPSDSITRPKNGEAKIQDGTVIMYRPNPGYVGRDDLVLNVSDGRTQQTEVVEEVTQADTGGGGDGSGGGATPAGNLATTGGDPVTLLIAGTASFLGFMLVQVSGRRRTVPLLAGARHLRT